MEPKEITEKDFTEAALSSDLPILAQFHAPWCWPCQAIAPMVEQLAEEYSGRLEV